MCYNPRKRFGLAMPDMDTDYAVWDLETEYSIDSESFISMGKATPFDGWKVYGRCLKTVADGTTVWDIKEQK